MPPANQAGGPPRPGGGGRCVQPAGAAQRRRRHRWPGQFFMLTAVPGAGRRLPAARALGGLGGRARDRLPGGRPGAAARGRCCMPSRSSARAAGPGFTLDDGPALLVGGGIGAAILPWLARALPQPPRALLGFRSEAHAVCAALVSDEPTVVLDPVLVTEPLARQLPFDGIVYACGPDPMLHAVAALCAEHDVDARWRWRRRWRAGSGRATAARCASTAPGNGSASRGRCSSRAGSWCERRPPGPSAGSSWSPRW